MTLDIAALKADFPLLQRVIDGRAITYLDSASSSQKPEAVLAAMDNYYRTTHANVHRGAYRLASDATDAMGCLRVYPGSHRLGRVEGADGRRANEVLLRYPIEQASVVEAKAGDVVFFHYFTLHGSMPNRSDRTRKTVLCQMYAGTDRVEDGNQHPDERLVLRGWNSHISRQAAGQAA